MAQGSAKLARAKKSAGGQKRKVVTKTKKGPKHHAAKGRKAQAKQETTQVTKSINRKNEAIASARAIGAGNTLFLKDLKEVGKSTLKQQARDRLKKESNASKLTDRMKDQLRKLGRDV